MDFEFNEEQLLIKKSAVGFAHKELNHEVIRRERDAIFSRQLWKKCAHFGIQGSGFPQEYGGNGADILSTMLLMEGCGLCRCPS
jgi:alkylation response protein AidB-like acyl-CoA dehydrogenase